MLICLALICGAFLFNDPGPGLRPANPTPTPEDNRPPGGQAGAATVVAADEPTTGQAFQSEQLPAPAFASAKPIKKPAGKTIVINNKEYPLITYKPALIPNDSQSSGWWVSNAKLNQTWDTAVSSPTLLAVIDTGFGLEHEEFSGRWYTNGGESGPASSEQPSTLNCSARSLALAGSCNLIDDNRDGIIDNETGAVVYENPSRLNCTAQSKPLTKDCNRIDDDGNGYIDDIRGWDFINFDNSVQAGELNPSGGGTEHGTMVAGVAAATGNNAKGIAGVDWNTKILPIQALDDDAYGDTLSVGQAILYAARQGADVINLSLGSSLPDDYVQEAVQTAIAMGSVVVAAAGNDGCDCLIYPANYPEVVAVGALDSTNQRAWFSSWGANLDIVAPGANINSATWTNANGVSAYVSGINGTSFAAPMVAGTLTRLLSQRPDSRPLQLIAAITESTNRAAIAAGTTRSQTLGFGALDTAKSTARMANPDNSVALYSFNPISTGRQLNSNQPAEVDGVYAAHSCASGTIGTTAIYELIKGGGSFFTISASEAMQAVGQGYSSSIFAHACMQQPHDTVTILRGINIFSEFRNSLNTH